MRNVKHGETLTETDVVRRIQQGVDAIIAYGDCDDLAGLYNTYAVRGSGNIEPEPEAGEYKVVEADDED